MAKEMTGNEKTVSAKFMGRDLFEFRQTAKLWLMTNHLPNIRGVDDGIWRRVRLVPFNRKFTDAEKDTRMGERLMEERDAVLTWMVEGCLKWQKQGRLKTPERVAAATAEYREEMDVLGLLGRGLRRG